MKKVLITMSLVVLTIVAFSQNNAVIINGGYSWVNVDASEIKETDPNVTGTGWRINGEYAWNPNDGSFAYGIAMGYISVSASYDEGSNPPARCSNLPPRPVSDRQTRSPAGGPGGGPPQCHATVPARVSGRGGAQAGHQSILHRMSGVQQGRDQRLHC